MLSLVQTPRSSELVKLRHLVTKLYMCAETNKNVMISDLLFMLPLQ